MLDKQNEGKKAFLTGAFTLTAGLLLSKVFGAVYRIPLTNMLGVYGMGIYQLIFPLFALFMTLATAGIPTAISKSVAEKLALDDKRGALAVTKTALLFLGGLGTVAAVILFGLSEVLANIQKAPETVTAYRIISASIPLCSLSAGFKGYFNGTMNMKPASVMHITEQSVKLVVGLAAVASQLPDVIAGVYAAVFAIVISDAIGLILSAVWFFRKNGTLRNIPIKDGKNIIKQLISLSVPLTLTGMILPALHLADSFLFQNLTKENATELYGLWSGPAHSLISMPSMLTMGIAAAIVPGIAKSIAAGDKKGADENLNLALKLSFAVTLPASAGLALIGKPIGAMLYPALTEAELDTFSLLLVCAAPGIIAMTLLMITSSALQAQGAPYVPVISLLTAAAIKLIAGGLCYKNQGIGVLGESISDSASYMVACFINLWYSVYGRRCSLNLWHDLLHPLAAALVMSFFLVCMNLFLKDSLGTVPGTCVAIIGAGAVYILTMMLTGFIKPVRIKEFICRAR